MQSSLRVTLVLPIYHDETTVREVVTRARNMLHRCADEYEIIVVDDCSPDGAGKIADELADEHGAVVRVIHHAENRGYGAAIKTGIEAARYEWICTVDGDNEYDVYDIEKMLNLRSYYLLVIAFRYKKLYSTMRIFISFVYNMLLRWMFRTRFRDVSTGIRAFHRSILEEIEITSNGPFFGAELAIKATLRGYPVGEIGIQTYPRSFGKSSTTSMRSILLTMSDMIRVRRQVFSDDYQVPKHRPRQLSHSAGLDVK